MKVNKYSLIRNSFKSAFVDDINSDDKIQKRGKVKVQELCESRGGRPGLSVLTSLLVSMDVKQYWTMLRHWSQLVPNMSADIRGH